MKIIPIAFIALMVITSCTNSEKKLTPTTVTEPNKNVEMPKNTNVATVTPLIDKYAKIIGSFVGAFGDNKITMLITNFKGDSVFGRSIVAMNDRPFKGTVAYGNGAYTIAASEPGDDKHDGKFNFSINENNMTAVSGKWEAKDPKITPKTFTLNKKAFVYNKNAGEFAQASQKLLKEEEVENLSKEELGVMRNNIFARHGYVFYKKATRDLYENAAWYVPFSVDVTKDLTAIEKTNIEMIKRYEKYAVEYGDDFGR